MRPVGLGAACLVCGERRRDNLRSVEFQRKWVPLCHTCSTRTFQLQPIPRTIEAVRQRLSRDRRWQLRRVGRTDQRFYPSNRRGGDRRDQKGMNGEYIDASELVVEIIDEGGANEGLTYNNDATRIALEDDQDLFEGRDEIFLAEKREASPRADVTGPHQTRD